MWINEACLRPMINNVVCAFRKSSKAIRADNVGLGQFTIHWPLSSTFCESANFCKTFSLAITLLAFTAKGFSFSDNLVSCDYSCLLTMFNWIAVLLISFSLPSVFGSQLETRTCQVSLKQLEKSGKILFLFGDRGVNLTRNDQDVEQHCSKMRRNIGIATRFGQCQKPVAKQVVSIMLSGYKRELKKQCASNEWRKGLVDAFDCFDKRDKLDPTHRCMDQCESLLNYTLKEVPKEHKMLLGCCIFQITRACIAKETLKVCGQQRSEFFEAIIDSYMGEPFSFVCGKLDSMDKCLSTFPQYMKSFDSVKVSRVSERSVLGLMLRMALTQANN